MGIYALSLAVALVTVATFFHEQIAGVLGLSPPAASFFVSLGFWGGGISGGCGVVLAVAGLFLRSGPDRQHPCRLAPSLIILCAFTFIFILLLVAHFRGTEYPPPLRPGETITI
jgi:hypothetical protein